MECHLTPDTLTAIAPIACPSRRARCPLVRLHPIPKALLERRDKVPALSPEACHMLLCELALFFLIWTEAANVRHMPEAMWFLWWCCAHTVAFTELCCSSGMLHVPAVGQGPAIDSDLREQRVRCRNAYQVCATQPSCILLQLLSVNC